MKRSLYVFMMTTLTSLLLMRRAAAFSRMSMSTTVPNKALIVPRIKTVDATTATDYPVVVKGWVRTVRKQKTLAFVEVNDGSNLSGIQCVLSFDQLDEATIDGESLHYCICRSSSHKNSSLITIIIYHHKKSIN